MKKIRPRALARQLFPLTAITFIGLLFIVVISITSSVDYVLDKTGYWIWAYSPSPHLGMWVVNQQGQIQGSAARKSPPLTQQELESFVKRPDFEHKFQLSDGRGTLVLRRDTIFPDRYWIQLQRPMPFKEWVKRQLFLLPYVLLHTIFCGQLGLFYLRSRTRRFTRVMEEMKRGNLQSRISVDRVDEFGEIMIQFNNMAAQVEGLVKKLQIAEQSRAQMIQELAHDLRTPLTSVFFLIERAADPSSGYSLEQVQEKLEIVKKELEYFRKLIEDLFLLARISEPQYQAQTERIDLVGLIGQEIDRAEQGHNGPICFQWDPPDSLFVRADAYLLRRLFRNAFENACTFAKTSITVHFERAFVGQVIVTIRDDGPGLSDSALESFGKKRASRFLDASRPGNVSLGLGSVIMQSIAKAYGGNVNAHNWRRPDGSVGGAELTLVLAVPTEGMKRSA